MFQIRLSLRKSIYKKLFKKKAGEVLLGPNNSDATSKVQMKKRQEVELKKHKPEVSNLHPQHTRYFIRPYK